MQPQSPQHPKTSSRRFRRVFVHVVAIFCGLFVGSFLLFCAWQYGQHNAWSWKALLAFIIAPVAGFESWRQTVRLNLKDPDVTSA
jgi:hypothetical protein